MIIKLRKIRRYHRHKRIRAKIYGSKEVPRLCVFRSNKHIYGQIIDDSQGKVIIKASDFEIKKTKPSIKKKSIDKEKKQTDFFENRRIVLAYKVGQLIADKALKNKIKKVIFDRAGYKYQGRVKGLAEGARGKGLKF